MWTAPAADSAAPVPKSALGWCAPAPVLTRHSSVSASRSPPWSHVVHCEVPGTGTPTEDRPVVKKETEESGDISDKIPKYFWVSQPSPP